MTKENILLVSQFGSPIRGVSPYSDALLVALANRNELGVHPVDYRAPYPALLHPANKKVISTTGGDLHYGNPFSWRRLARMEADIIHLQHWLAPMSCYLAPLASLAKKSGKKIVVTMHNPVPHEPLPWTRPFEHSLISKADVIVVHNQSGVTALNKKFNGIENKVVMISHGINVSSEPQAASPQDYANLNLDPSKRYFSLFGNLRGYKGVDVLLNAWSQIFKQIPDVDLVIAGSLWTGKSGFVSHVVAKILGTNQVADNIQRLLSQPELSSRVHLLEGFQPDSKIDSLIRISDLAVFPYTHFNSQSGAACRAAGMGCPVLVSDIGGLPDLTISDQWVVSPENAEALAKSLHAKLTAPSNLTAARMEQIKQVQSYSWKQIARAHIELYRMLLAR